MKKSLISLLLLLTLSSSVCAQRLKQTGKNVKELVPEGWTIQEAWGDLCKNGRDDLVVMAVPNDSAGITIREDGYVLNANQPVLAIYFKSEEGNLIKRCEYDNVIPPLADPGYFTEVELKVTERGALSITLDIFFTAGSYTTPRQTYIFRYQNEDFYLIGEDVDYYTRTTGDGESVSTNYLTGKQSKTTYNEFTNPAKKPKTRWTSIGRKPLRKLGSFTLGE